MIQGPHGEGENVIDQDDAEIETALEAGMYTIEVTTEGRNSDNSGTYTLTVRDSSPSAYLFPSPRSLGVGSSASLFTLYSSGNVKVVANTTGSDQAVQLTTYRPSSSSSSCLASQNAQAYRVNRNYIYLKGCKAGESVLELRDWSTDRLLNIYRVNVK